MSTKADMARKLVEKVSKTKADQEAQLLLQSGASQPEHNLSPPRVAEQSVIPTGSSGSQMGNFTDNPNKRGRSTNDAV